MILVLNAGSSSLKYKLFDEKSGLAEKLAGKIERIGITGGLKNHAQAFEQALVELKNYQASITSIGHRLVHGGDLYQKTTPINDEVIDNLKEIAKLAPLHEPAEIETIEQAKKSFKNIKQFAVFDTAFYASLPKVARIYGLPYEYFKKGIKRYGFHGTSHQYVLLEVAKKLRKRTKDVSLISLHLGAGSSITAVKKGEAVDTSMGFTPLEGLLMGTRSGDLDPGIIISLLQEDKLSPSELDVLLNEKSGLLGISGVSSDMLDILFICGYPIEDKKYTPPSNLKCDKEKIERAKMAVDLFVFRAQKYISSFRVHLPQLDAIVFTGAVGYGSTFLRDKIMSGLGHVVGEAKVYPIKTDEELQIAREIITG